MQRRPWMAESCLGAGNADSYDDHRNGVHTDDEHSPDNPCASANCAHFGRFSGRLVR